MFRPKRGIPAIRPNRLTSVLGLAALMLLAALPARADLIDCSGSSGQENIYQVYIDELNYASTGLVNDPELNQLMQLLSFKLETKIQEMLVADGHVPLAFAYCDERRPAGSGSFDSSLVEHLDDQQVILEVWGMLDADEGETGITARRAQIGYVLVPVLSDLPEHQRSLGFQYVDYSSDAQDEGQIIDVLEQSAELRAFVSLGLGLNLLANERYDEALTYLCRALVYLDLESQEIEEGRREELTAYIEQKTRDLIADAGAAADPHETSVLMFLEPDNPCGR